MAPPNARAGRVPKSEAQLLNAISRYARLMRKADRGRLQGDELDQLLLTALRMRNDAWQLGVTNKELEQMLENMVQYQAQRSS
ncbi:MAG: hypothetical protein OEN20_04310 [Gammaproteobacteria bacterium]|nr:hypothetical protein [Gammaproteobacteria bacterium]